MENFVQTQIETKALFQDGYQHLNRDRHPDLSLHRVFGSAVESFDAQVLFDPSKESFHLPAGSIKLSDRQSGQEKVVGRENEPRLSLDVEVVNPPQRIGIPLSGLGSGESDRLVRSQPRGLVDGMRVAAIELHVLFGTGHEEGTGLGEEIEAREIQVAAVEQVEGSRFEKQFVQKVDIVDLAAGHLNTGRNAAPQVQECVNLYRAFAPPKLCPGKQRQTQIDGGRVEGVDRLVPFHAERFLLIKVAGSPNQARSEIGKDAPVAVLVGVSKGSARNGTSEAHVVKLRLLSSEARFDVA